MSGASDWPVDLRGVTETVVTTPGPAERWNVAALGVHAPDGARQHPTARTWGATRTRRNFERGAACYVQFTRDPVDFAEAALTVREAADPLLASADAWVRVNPTRLGRGTEADTTWVDWELAALESAVRARSVPTTNRGHAAVIEATVAASRLDVPAYDREELASRLEYLAGIADRCGGAEERAAFDVIRDAAEW